VPKTHHYELSLAWTGNTGTGTSAYRAYDRAHDVMAAGKSVISGSADPSFRGDSTRWNPEELLVASVAQCHMLWYLSLCANEGVIVTGYLDHPSGSMIETADGSGRFEEIVLRPQVTLADPGTADLALALHARAHQMCYIANSVNFMIRHEPSIVTALAGTETSLTA
jgi:organic hydroperoxide reductase OsmC/OhrA